MDIATLGLEVRSDGVVVAKDRLRDFQGEAKRSETATDKLSASVKRMATSFVAGAAAAFSFRAITSVLSGFEQSMASVAAITGATGQELASLRDIAKELGATTEFSASQAADGLKFLGMAGFDAAESISAIPDVLNLATAASMDLAQAADITSNIMGAFGIAATNANQAADVLALAASRANTDVAQLGSAMAMAGPVANALGVDIGETAAAIGALSDLGIQGSMAGTGLRRVLSSLANATPAATKALNGLGLSMADLNPATNELVDIVDRLAAVNLSAADAFTIFGDRGAPAILALIENNAKLRELTGELGNAEGAARRMAETMRDNLGGDFKGLVSSVEAVIIALGESGLTGVLRSMTQTATTFLRTVADNMDAILRAATGLAVYMGGAWVVQFGLAAAATTALSASLRLLRLAIAGTGIGALVLIVTDVVFRIYDAVTATDELAGTIDDAAETGRSFFQTLQVGAEAIASTFDWAASSIATVMLGAFATIRDAFTGLMNLILDGLSMIPGVDVGKWKGDAAAGTKAFLRSQEETRTAYQAMLTNWRRFTQGEWMDRDLGGNDITAEWERFNSAGGAALTDLTDKSDALAGAIDGVGGSLTAANDNLKEMGNIGQQVTQTLASGFSDIFKRIVTGSGNAMEAVGQLLSRLGDLFINNAFQMLFGGLFGGMFGGGGNIMTSLGPRMASFNPGIGWMSMEGGGFTGYGPRSGGIDGRGGIPAILHPNETVIDHTRPANQNQHNDNSRGDLHIHINGSGLTEEQLGRAIANGIREYDGALAPKVEAKFRQMQSDPRAADGGW